MMTLSSATQKRLRASSAFQRLLENVTSSVELKGLGRNLTRLRDRFDPSFTVQYPVRTIARARVALPRA